MILRRFMEHVKDQNWFAVGLDVCVVIVGIFLGLQVSEWNDGRRAVALEREYLERILTDVDRNLALYEPALENARRQSEKVATAAEILYSGDLSGDRRATFDEAISHIGNWQGHPILRGALDELISTGQLSLIRSPAMRDHIHEFLAASDIHGGANDNLQTLFVAALDHIFDRFDIRPGGGVSISNSNEDLLKDREASRLLMKVARNYGIILWNIEQSQKFTEKFRDDVAAELERLSG